MSFPAGTQCYEVDSPPVRARGVIFDASVLDDEAAVAVRAVAIDEPGQRTDQRYLASLDPTGFSDDVIADVLGSAEVTGELARWRAGEAVAQAELEANRGCDFPWNVRRDLKNPSASLPGAELVGFHQRDEGTRFAFGEVKTSVAKQSPPSVTTDLRRQLRQLRDDATVVTNLVRYLVPRMRSSASRPLFEEAFRAYVADRQAYGVFGVLVREVDEPDERDLRGMAKDFAPGTQSPTSLELRALYFPGGAVARMGNAETS